MKSFGGWVPGLMGASIALVSVQPGAVAKTPTEVNRMAQAIAVRVDGGSTGGSGTIVQKEGDVYTVLTAAHVAFDRASNKVITKTVTTPDDQKHQIVSGSIRRLSANVDLAIVKFRSSNSYQVAELGDSNKLEGGMEIYVAGFPAPTPVITERIFVFRRGQVTANSTKVFKDGYALLYENSTLPGMSGGPVLNEQGQLVAVHGRGDRDQGNGEKTGFNAGIPIARFVDLAKGRGVSLATGSVPTAPVGSPKADDFLVAATEKWSKRDYAAALVDVNRAIGLNPKLAAAYSRRGTIKDALNDTSAAMADYNKAIQLNPRLFVAYNNRGVLKSNKLNDFKGALADYNKALEYNPQFALGYRNRGVLKSSRFNDFTGALADYNKAIELEPKSGDGYNGRANLKADQLDDFSGAMADYNKAIELDPKSALYYRNRGILKADRLKDFPGALADYNRAIDLEPKSGDSYNSRANLKADRLKDFSGALADYNRAIELNPKSALFHRNRGILKVDKLKDFSGALADYGRAIELNPRYVDAYNRRGNLRKDKFDDFSGALADYNRAIELNPKEPSVYYNRGVLKNAKLKDFPGAVADFRQAARLYRQQNNRQDLQDTLNQLRRLGATEE
jgi:tetratricopeptide (TPR) repeat protein/V8-like Glu-specific endopeptidase